MSEINHGWQDIATAPRDGTLKLFATANGSICIAPDVEPAPLSAAERLEMAKMGEWPDHKAWRVTHWMPLPPPPAA